MERIMKAQALTTNSVGSYMASSKTLEINPKNPIIEEIRKRTCLDSSDKTVKDLVMLLFDTSLICSGFSLENPNIFSGRIYRMILLGLSLQETEEIENINEEVDLTERATKMEEVD